MRGAGDSAAEPQLSVVVVAFDMGRELPRTLRSLCPEHQVGLQPLDYEVIVVDNGSSVPVDESVTPAGSSIDLRIERLDPAPASPAAAANRGIELARGDIVGLIVDGARIASPGLLARARVGVGLAARPVVVTLGWHLGGERHGDPRSAHDRDAEDALLAAVSWPDDGYRLFEVSTLAHSSSRGWFGPIGESSAVFMSRSLWQELGGLDTAFALPGGGLVNHDLYRRAVEADGTQPVMLLGEGTFHQTHGGAATSGRFGWEEMQADYERLRGRRYTPPTTDPIFVGQVPPQARRHLLTSLAWLQTSEGGATPAQRPWRRPRLRRPRLPG